MLGDQVFQSDVLGQPHRWYQPGVRHQIRIIEPCVCLGRGVQQSHPRGALSILALRFDNPHSPRSKGTSAVTTRSGGKFGRWIQVEDLVHERLKESYGLKDGTHDVC
ncbi:MAG TPA: hypothetical protein VHS32_00520, partial [Streptosporangiaceae bacterium]|nr:hypothetical protein [Streptosporangiaceae bacterium]